MPTESVKESFEGMLGSWRDAVGKIVNGTGAAEPDAEDLSYADGTRHCATDAQRVYDRLVGLAEQWRIDADALGPSDCADQLTEILQGGNGK